MLAIVTLRGIWWKSGFYLCFWDCAKREKALKRTRGGTVAVCREL